MFRGSIVAIVTPFKNGAVDEEKLRELVEFQIAGGTDAIVPCGTTGESSTLDYEEHDRVIEVVVQQVNGRVPVIAGTGSNSTREAIEMTAHARKIGADGALLVTPYYNKPSQEGLYRHYRAIAEAVGLPHGPLQRPGRTGVNLLPETVARLANLTEHRRHQGGDRLPPAGIRGPCPVRRQIDVISGDDFITFPMMACGAKGVISVTANIMPERGGGHGGCLRGRKHGRGPTVTPETAQDRNAMFIESNPVPVKTAVGLMGKAADEMRLPLCADGEANKARLAAIMKEYNLI